jgi:hypothetical protein
MNWRGETIIEVLSRHPQMDHRAIMVRCPECGGVASWEQWGMITMDTDEECVEPGDEWKDDGLTLDAGECPDCSACPIKLDEILVEDT